MKNYDSLYNPANASTCYPNASRNDLVIGNSIDMNLQKTDTDVRADIVVSRVNSVRIWGIVKDCDGYPIPNAMIKLVKPINKNGVIEYDSVAFTLADSAGFYQMDAPTTDSDSKYKLLVSKSCVGSEKIIYGEPSKHYPPQHQHQHIHAHVPPAPPCPPPAQVQSQPCPPPQPQAQQCPPANPPSHINPYTSNIEKRPVNYAPEPVHSQFYGELVNKGNIFKKTE